MYTYRYTCIVFKNTYGSGIALKHEYVYISSHVCTDIDIHTCTHIFVCIRTFVSQTDTGRENTYVIYWCFLSECILYETKYCYHLLHLHRRSALLVGEVAKSAEIRVHLHFRVWPVFRVGDSRLSPLKQCYAASTR